MSQSEKYIKNIAPKRNGINLNTPVEYADRQKQIYSNATRRFYSERSKYASDYDTAEVQGLGADFYEYTPTYIRLADMTQNSAYSTRRTDDFKQALFPALDIDYVPIGAKVQTMGSTWLVINPENISSVNVKTVLARCNASYNSYDEYGNVVTEPIVIEKSNMLGNNNESPQNLVLMDGYFEVTCQKNANTSKLGENSRIILGSKPYHITGFTDFIQEFTGNRESTHLLTFTVRVEEPVETDDIEKDFIANGKTENFGAAISGAEEITAGGQTTLTATFLYNDEPSQLPATWEWTTSDENVATVENGVVSGIGAGNAVITAKLTQNPHVQATFNIAVGETPAAPYVAFTSVGNTTLKQFRTALYSAAYYDGGETQEIVRWTISDKRAVNYLITGNTIALTCINSGYGSVVLTASRNGASASITITLEGY
ncbi:MAG: hypothetical protein IKU30_02240 [Clostridia bacterium]|nr:hypothetical protein [Clostridia bacterium]